MSIEQQYQETINWMYKQLPMFTRIGAAAYKPNLDNTIQLCERLGNPHLKFKSVHIAGTNGKGSCSNLLAAAFQQAGYRTALYTSPHLFDFRERIKINGEDISKQRVVDFIEKNKQIIDEIKPSFFELTVAMAFTYFAEQDIDIAVIEVGLGGLLDSTNIILPELSVITNISNDHAYLLGNTLQEIARQKAGIIKENIPVVIGETQPETEKIFIATAVQNNCPIFFADQRYQAVFAEQKETTQLIKIVDSAEMKIYHILTNLMGKYQSKNIITVLNALAVLQSADWDFSKINIETVFSSTKKLLDFKGRYDVIKTNPEIILDVSHNEAGIAEVIKQVMANLSGTLHIVTGFVQDKEIDNILKLFPKQAIYYFVNADIPRALPAIELHAKAEKLALHGNAYTSIERALQDATTSAKYTDKILVTGSFFILEEAYRHFE